MAFCPKCGKEVAVGAEFCAACGNKISAESANNSKKLHCPNCKSHNLTVTTETSVDGAISTGRNIRTTTVSNTHRNYWICSECGTKFRNIQGLEEEIKKSKNNPKFACGIFIVGVIIFLYTIIMGLNNPFAGFVMIYPCIFGIACAIVGFIYIFVYKKKNKEMAEELKYLKENCFDQNTQE